MDSGNLPRKKAKKKPYTIEILTCGVCKYFKTNMCPEDVTDPDRNECVPMTDYRQLVDNLKRSVKAGKFECTEQLTEIPKGSENGKSKA